MSGSRVAALRRSFKEEFARPPQPSRFKILSIQKAQAFRPIDEVVKRIAGASKPLMKRFFRSVSKVDVTRRNEFRMWKRMYRAGIHSRAQAPQRVKPTIRKRTLADLAELMKFSKAVA